MKNVVLVTMFLIAMSMVSGTFAADQNSGFYPFKENIDVQVNEMFTITLVSNPSTGYYWEPLYDSEYLSLVSSDFIPSESGLIGAYGTHKFVFKALKTGETDLSICKISPGPWDPEPWIEPCDNIYPIYNDWRFYHVSITE
jgi:inhibitor of cysteine peptidase